ncbi:colicin immunity protein [Yersinia thracica]|uniref:Colicin immunity protein n=3 Tax=Yersinia TaxID=629 RepID=A0A0T9R578_9GAMM|nr:MULTISPECIES: bacteriocin immunity protein [Yersinia]EEQ04695.1 Colicin immunity protein/pyocin immunity protein [Yersinia bercovieri ATCC 43970]QKJ06692.1 bacteriocin immunity protein [Yersinia bercovieri ATCC 43970]CNF78606.1 colicin immunity protein [Yersinia bercovieri]CNI42875.1 colicin immunity protein [Yersinia thracica]
MELKNSITEYTESDFLDFLNKILAVEVSENEHDELIRHFVKITEHPQGNGVLFYPETEAEASPEGILNVIKKWRAENGKPGFKE